MSDFLVKRDNLRQCQITESGELEPAPGQALLRVDSFGLTANNITYAVMGQLMSYWDFFPAQDGWGRVPMWGFAEVERSEAEGVEPGTRLYGYLPPSSYLLVTPAEAGRGGFIDGSPHRATLPSVYQGYLATDPDPFYKVDTEELQMLLRPLFLTSFLIDDQLADEGFVERGPIVISSASSKTAIGTAFLMAQRKGVELVGLTSARSAEFVESLGIYGQTVTYDAIASLQRGPATFVDIAGDGAVRLAVHSHYGDELIHSMTVGVTHWESSAPARVSCRGLRQPSSSPPIAWPSAPRTGAASRFRRELPMPGTHSASGPVVGSRSSAVGGSMRFSAYTSMCSRVESTPRPPMCSRSTSGSAEQRQQLLATRARYYRGLIRARQL